MLQSFAALDIAFACRHPPSPFARRSKVSIGEHPQRLAESGLASEIEACAYVTGGRRRAVAPSPLTRRGSSLRWMAEIAWTAA